jgi:alpha-beta hydrolase superfamily lysophospholipase
MISSSKSAYLPSNLDNESRLFFTLFSPETPKATLLIVHGMQEHSGRYSEIAEYFAGLGIAVVTYDHLGHGRSVRRKKEIGFFQLRRPHERLIADAEMMADYLAGKYPDVPHFILGHSMGSFITRCLLQRSSKNFAGAIITGTGGPLPGISVLKGYLSLANFIAPHHRTILNTVFTKVNNTHFKKDKDFGDTSWLSVNSQNRRNFEKDDLCGIPFTNNAFYTLFSIYKKATSRQWASSLSPSFPFLFVSGENDPIGDFGKGVTQTVDHLRSDGFQHVDINLYPNMRHEILNEEIREKVLSEIYEWMLKYCK